MNDSQILRFPERFVWGAATASTQVDGAAAEGGKSESIWDRFAADASRIADGTNPAVTCDHYHRYRDEFDLMQALGVPGRPLARDGECGARRSCVSHQWNPPVWPEGFYRGGATCGPIPWRACGC